ncbi:unnamed protein product [Adineta steineri]|uniref:RNA polymerase II subunit A C-terminal domain phosphatase n=1 Tax=Adineta steineri TaxID=433720 RepID=A0A815EBF4_9BILA|nr:unnamed protein product [Adineta steineri]CAF3800142.1 unnamed protein product [Adineta steineri]
MNGQRVSFPSPTSGIITKLYIHEMDVLSYSSIIFEYEACRHSIIFKNLCGDCGIDLSQIKNTLLTSKHVNHVVPIEPSFSAIKFTAEIAAKYDREERNYLLRKRKLHLLVDLDQTLVHTTNCVNHYPSSPDVVAFQLNIPISQTLYTKLRPGVKEFLTNLQLFYQFHIVTFGDRPYANAIAKLIDPDGKFFSDRILSRDECVSLTDKSANLNRLFPCGDSLVCIIDDREDVWKYAPNLIQVKPYTWFKDIGDINDTYLSSINKSNDGNYQFYTENNELTELSQMETLPIKNTGVANDDDLYLYRLEIILKHIHMMFYKSYDQSIENKSDIIPDLKQIMPNIRQQILKSVSLCFSHMMSQDYPLEKYCGTVIAKAMGATVTHDLQFDHNGTIQTTHVIAGKQAYRVYQARQNNIKVVTPEWLIDCYEQWEKKLEENYVLTPDYNVQQCKLFTDITPRISKRRYCEIQQQVSTIDQLISHQLNECTMNINERFDIEKKVTDLRIDDDIDLRPSKRQCTVSLTNTVNEKKDDDGEDSDSSYTYKMHNLILNKEDRHSSDEEGLSDDETPRGWKQK